MRRGIDSGRLTDEGGGGALCAAVSEVEEG